MTKTGKTQIDIPAVIMPNVGVRMEKQELEKSGPLENHLIILKIIVVPVESYPVSGK